MASDPVVVSCPVGVWVKVASSVVSGVIHKIGVGPGRYSQTYRVAGAAAPTDDTDAAPLFDCCNSAQISSDAAIDVYVKARGAAGSVRPWGNTQSDSHPLVRQGLAERNSSRTVAAPC